MKFYRNHYGAEQDHAESAGFSFFTSKRAALNDAKEKIPYSRDDNAIAAPIDVTPTKSGICNALNVLAGHPDNG